MERASAGIDPVVERRRLEECAREPIRTPGRIQSHGMLLGVDSDSHFITLASENASQWLGAHIDDLACERLSTSVESANPVDPIRVELNGEEFDAIVHRLDGRTIVELEPTVDLPEYARTSIVGAIQRLSNISDSTMLRSATAAEIKTITGFDRVMIYDFYEDGHGEVAAESCNVDMEPYLGLHFPASDIPTQARELYVTKLSRAIVSTVDAGSPILALDEGAASVDLSHAELRAVSPFHLQFMRNMGQESTVSFSLVSNGRLHGMITCAHSSPRRLPVLLRRAVEVLATQLSLQLVSIKRLEKLNHDLEVLNRRSALLAPLYAAEDVADTLLDGEVTVLDLIPADGVALRVNGEVRWGGDVPTPESISSLLAAVGSMPLVTEAVLDDHPELADLMPGFAGLLVVPLRSDHDILIFFRREVARVVTWLGDQSPENRPTPVSPRMSFSAWRQSVTGTSLAWGDVEHEAMELGRELEGALVRRAESQLAVRDPLTGLHNRRALLQSLSGYCDGRALLFIDLDEFKRINDTLGHDAGDDVITEVGRRLLASARTEDLVVRLGGDEFVIVCDGVERDEALSIADRVVAAIGNPMTVGAESNEVVVTASCGVVVAPAGSTGAGILDRADKAMYRAKDAGRNRVAE